MELVGFHELSIRWYVTLLSRVPRSQDPNPFSLASKLTLGFLLTYLLHTSHASKNGSRAGLGITLIQLGVSIFDPFFYKPPSLTNPSPTRLSTFPRTYLSPIVPFPKTVLLETACRPSRTLLERECRPTIHGSFLLFWRTRTGTKLDLVGWCSRRRSILDLLCSQFNPISIRKFTHSNRRNDEWSFRC